MDITLRPKITENQKKIWQLSRPQNDYLFTNIKIIFLSSNSPASTQSLDQGIIKAFKSKFFKKIMLCYWKS